MGGRGSAYLKLEIMLQSIQLTKLALLKISEMATEKNDGGVSFLLAVSLMI